MDLSMFLAALAAWAVALQTDGVAQAGLGPQTFYERTLCQNEAALCFESMHNQCGDDADCSFAVDFLHQHDVPGLTQQQIQSLDQTQPKLLTEVSDYAYAQPSAAEVSQAASVVNVLNLVWSIVYLLVLCGAGYLYFWPSIAAHRHQQNFVGVLLINIFLGWTLVGWLVALFLAYRTRGATSTVVKQVAPPHFAEMSLEQIERLHSLLQSGAITQVEFDQEKARLLRR